MSFDPSSIESDLGRLRASSLDASLLARLEACADDSWTSVVPTEAAYEQELKSRTPASLPPALMDSLLATVSTTRFPEQQNIVLFPHAREASPAPRSQRGRWRAAAAVAIAGALAAWMVPPARQGDSTAAAGSTAHPPAAHADAGSANRFVPAGFARGLAEASDEGVIWQKDNRPHRVLRVVYKDRVTLKDENGKTYQVEQPRVEYIIVPAKTD